MWWALWCHSDRVDGVLDVCARLNVRVAVEERRMKFPAVTVIPVLAKRVTIELMMFASDGIAELRFANDTPTFFIDHIEGEEDDWVDGLAERITWPGAEAPAVCILDAGINRGHSLIEPELAPQDMYALEPDEWGLDDHDDDGHGTAMAGLALHGNLTAALSDGSEKVLMHRLESLKVLPPEGNDPNELAKLRRLYASSHRTPGNRGSRTPTRLLHGGSQRRHFRRVRVPVECRMADWQSCSWPTTARTLSIRSFPWFPATIARASASFACCLSAIVHRNSSNFLSGKALKPAEYLRLSWRRRKIKICRQACRFRICRRWVVCRMDILQTRSLFYRLAPLI
jgi:hypothetical protein